MANELWCPIQRVPCVKEQCAWWCRARRCCEIKSLCYRLEIIFERLFAEKPKGGG